MILRFVKIHLKLLGILQSHDKRWSTSVLRIGLVFASLGIFTIPTFCFFLCEAVTFDDYVNSFFFTSCGILGISFYTLLLWEKTNINHLIANLEETIQKRSKLFCLWKLTKFNKRWICACKWICSFWQVKWIWHSVWFTTVNINSLNGWQK